VALCQAQPEGLGPFFRPPVLSVIYIEQLCRTPSALLDEKMNSSSGEDETATDPRVRSECRNLQPVGPDDAGVASPKHALLKTHFII